MPKRHTERPREAEADLAQRIAHERERRGWSYEAVAKLMARAGCPMQATTVFKIEKGTPRPRRVTVDELVAFSRVFGLGVEELLIPIELIEQRRARAVIEELDEVGRQTGRLIGRELKLYLEYFSLLASNPELTDYIDNHWRSSARAAGEHLTGLIDFGDGLTLTEDELEGIASAMGALQLAVQEAASAHGLKAYTDARTREG